MSNYSGNAVRTWATGKDVHPQYPSPDHAGGTAADIRPQLDAKTVPATDNYAGTVMPVYDAVGGGYSLWNPIDSHDSEGATYPLYNDGQQAEAIANAHSDPNHQYGYVRAEYITPLLQGAHEVYSDTARSGFTPIPVNQTVLAHGRQGWGYTQNQGAVAPRLGTIRQTTTLLFRNQHRRDYGYQPQPLTQRNGGLVDNTHPQTALGSSIPAWVPGRSLHKDDRPGVWSAPEPVDESLLASPNSGYDSTAYGDTVF